MGERHELPHYRVRLRFERCVVVKVRVVFVVWEGESPGEPAVPTVALLRTAFPPRAVFERTDYRPSVRGVIREDQKGKT